MKFLLLTFVLSLSLNSFAQQGPTENCPYGEQALKIIPNQGNGQPATKPEAPTEPQSQNI